MDLAFAKKFLMSYLPEEAKIPVHEIFGALEIDPQMMFINGLIYTYTHDVKSQDKRISVAAINGLVSGFAMAYTMEMPEVKRQLQEYLEFHEKSKGENVLDFMMRRKK